LKVLSGELAPDGGVVWRAPSTRVARLAQDADALGDAKGLTVFDAVAAGLGDLRDLVRDYHHTASEGRASRDGRRDRAARRVATRPRTA
jgi:ATP-binding cassette subfamily F protein uup